MLCLRWGNGGASPVGHNFRIRANIKTLNAGVAAETYPLSLPPVGNFCSCTQVQYSLTSIRGVGRRFSNLICKKAEVDPNKRCVHNPAITHLSRTYRKHV